MGRKRKAWLAWALCGLVTCLSIVLFGVDLLRQAGSKNLLQIASDGLFSLVLPVVTAIVAALIVSRQPRNTIGWLLMVQVVSFLVSSPIEEYMERLASSSPAPTPSLLFVVWFSGWSWMLLIFPLLLITLLFPTGRPPTPRWRWVGVAAITWAAILLLLVTLSQPLSANTSPNLILDNPLAVLSQETADPLFGAWVPGFVALIGLCVASLLVRYRHAGYIEREQIKWLLYAGAVFLVMNLVGTVSGLTDTSSDASDIWNVFFGLSMVAFPAAIGVAILRYHLWNIEVIIRRTLVYGALTTSLALVYFGGVALLQWVLGPLVGGDSEVVLVVSTLAIAALFQPLRRRIQGFVDRRFYRSRYDAARTLADFSARLRDEVDLDRIGEELVTVVGRTMRPEHVSLWLRQWEQRQRAAR